MIGDSVTLEFLGLENCDLTYIKQHFNRQFFGVPVQKTNYHADLLHNVSQAIIDFGMKGELQVLHDKWWPKEL